MTAVDNNLDNNDLDKTPFLSPGGWYRPPIEAARGTALTSPQTRRTKTVLAWSFVRDDQPAERTCRQIALAIRDEVADLEAAGVAIIQIDEPGVARSHAAPPRRQTGIPQLGRRRFPVGLLGGGRRDPGVEAAHLVRARLEQQR